MIENEDLDRALDDSRALLRTLSRLGVRWICVTAGSPYYCPHIQRPAYFPPTDGYQPPEDPLRGVARQLQATAILKAAFPQMMIVGSAYSYLQEWLPHVAQYHVRRGLTDFVGLGRMVLAYPELPADVLAGAPLRRQVLCRTFSDCTTRPADGHGLRLLSARSVLQGPPGGGRDSQRENAHGTHRHQVESEAT